MPALGNMIRWGKESARAGPWPADGSVAFLVPVPDGARASAEFVRRCLGLLAEQGFQRVVTARSAPGRAEGLPRGRASTCTNTSTCSPLTGT